VRRLLPDNVRFELGAMDTARYTYMAEYTWFDDQEDNNPGIIRGCTVGLHWLLQKAEYDLGRKSSSDE
jgi:hypothetical protein